MIPPKTTGGPGSLANPVPPPITLTEIAGCLIVGTACVDMWLGVFTLIRCGIYALAVLLAFIGSGFRPRLSRLGALFVLAGALYILKALMYPPVPSLVRNDIRNILVGWAFLGTLATPDFSPETWKRFQRVLHRTMLLVSALGAFLGLAKLLYFQQGGIIPQLMDPERGYPLGTSLTMDYNFYSLPLLLGVISAFWLLKTEGSTLWRGTALVCLPGLLPAILLSGSRRGLVLILIMVPLLTAWMVIGKEARRGHESRPRVVWPVLLAMAGVLLFLCVAKFDTIAQGFSDLASADSLSDVIKRWETFEEGTYSESRVHYWTVTLQRLGRFGPLEYLLGEGFGYVTDLGADPELVEDYPHNFILSSMLYGGLTQTALLVTLVWLVLRRLISERSMLAGWFIVMIVFLSTSSNSLFSSELTLFLTVVCLGLSPSLGYRRIEPETRGRSLVQPPALLAEGK